MQPSFFLASGSPRRKELLTQLGYQFHIIIPDIEEQQLLGESPQDYVARLSREKAQAGLQLAQTQFPELSLPVLGSDTIVVINQEVLEKPINYTDCKRMLQLLSNRKHQVMTSVTVTTSTEYQTKTVITDVWFKPLTEQEIEAYWRTGEPCDKAGSYGIQGIGGRFVSKIEGSFHAVMGLPLMETDLLLNDFLGQPS
ncbi:Maf family protein [Vibrio rumoiensis]|uniref:dTTP/UTP pyrophosphatase n=1 Tax=Vibrio rumoiensis 1S-45 TaxID=1188252 RepID=A0A1E5E552_9VIBR|nr:Maf family protein [Vibrio rumoiensis]OEF28460.1 septum formation inhibitor Maf [Vibrio rumoiensis 1S-45]